MVDLTSEKTVVRGEFGDLSVADVLQALSISRQLLSVELFGPNGLSGCVTLKAGMILGVQLIGSDASGFAALRRLFALPLQTFRVERLESHDEPLTPIARLTAQLVSQYENAGAAAPIQAAPAPITTPTRITTPMPDLRAPDLRAPATARPAPSPGPLEPTPIPTPPEPARAPKTSATASLKCPVIAFVSPKGGCGKTTIALHVAIGLAKRGKRVVLVDCDVNGDVLSAVASRERAQRGVYDVVGQLVDPNALAIKTRMSNLRIVPAIGAELDADAMLRTPTSEELRELVAPLTRDADLVLIDAPAGMNGTTAQIIGAATHVVGVLQSEPIASRSFGMFRAFLDRMNRSADVLGVVINMFDRTQNGSVSAFTSATETVDPSWLFATTIPRTPALLAAAAQGQPLDAFRDHRSLAWLFEMLAEEIDDRLEPVQKSDEPDDLSPFLL